ncbi:MAG: hypothetical protein BZ151_13480 [Desulfobacca sp. 4484_104]|nr:MAG: hypothetical protein BZ151_13480 [Desulfobacca sp. 4484_104]
MFACIAILFGCSKNPAQKKADHLQRAQDYVKAEKYKEARIEYLNVVQIDPKDAKAHYQLGEVYLKLQEPKQAVREFYNARCGNFTTPPPLIPK